MIAEAHGFLRAHVLFHPLDGVALAGILGNDVQHPQTLVVRAFVEEDLDALDISYQTVGGFHGALIARHVKEDTLSLLHERDDVLGGDDLIVEITQLVDLVHWERLRVLHPVETELAAVLLRMIHRRQYVVFEALQALCHGFCNSRIDGPDLEDALVGAVVSQCAAEAESRNFQLQLLHHRQRTGQKASCHDGEVDVRVHHFVNECKSILGQVVALTSQCAVHVGAIYTFLHAFTYRAASMGAFFSSSIRSTM